MYHLLKAQKSFANEYTLCHLLYWFNAGNIKSILLTLIFNATITLVIALDLTASIVPYVPAGCLW